MTMKPFFLSLAIFGVCASASAAPKLSLPDATYRFEPVSQGETLHHEFTIKNDGDEPLAIQRVVPSCGCTISKLAKNSIAPGGETKLSVDFDTSGMSGEKVKTVRLYTNDPENLTALLTLQGEVQPEIFVEPRRLHFGSFVRVDVKDEETPPTIEKTISIRVRDGSKAKLESITSRSKWVEVETEEKSAKEMKLRVKLRKDLRTGEFRDRIVVVLSGAQQRTVNIPLYASVRNRIAVKPQVLAFGIVSPDGEKVTRKARIERKGDGEFRVLGAESDSPLVEVAVDEEKAGKLYRVTATLDQASVTKDFTSAIRLRVAQGDGEDEREEELLVSVTAVLPPDFLADRTGKK
jgi:hypothetical protein